MTTIAQLNWFTAKHFYCWNLVNANLAVGGKTVDTGIFVKSKNGNRKIIQFIRIKKRPPSRIRRTSWASSDEHLPS